MGPKAMPAADLLLLPLLLLTATVMQTLQAAHPFLPSMTTLDMAPASFDDQYIGCAQDMEHELAALNQTEFATSRTYAEAWEAASARWREHLGGGGKRPPWPPGFRDEHAVAVLAYTANGPLHREFNTAVREAGRSRAYYLRYFRFKTLHFLLTQALALLGAGQNPQCRRVYRGVAGVRFRTGAEPGGAVRFGHFASSSLHEEAALQFGQDSFFSIRTCHGADIRSFSFFPGEEEVLIPPYERFRVINASTGPHGPNHIYLQSLDKTSTYNCEYIKDKKCTSWRCRLNDSAAATGSEASLWLLLPLFWSVWLVLSPLEPF
ncbi:LOW QUALITY PROTEIN: GPI-linked NAD(P)(+)--arginine ADP-ribosyltransferase 1 [Tachyglossus aculeatus]|uniref:LOW QUALITY PROTEIN: GPI-linked NAD(P)(+)--arginine ADP-ribosyltransferase 1 n=1 Tax=Tachyglossus aculeatus TaxID=9261 RepID=UPI0018F5B293|nr:LOW QUALITY PROTEIN: GPI-linked NAD(P)(+)--arginine ADP-ribosyltransferase 1 [Tachyglossus aculeatus]